MIAALLLPVVALLPAQDPEPSLTRVSSPDRGGDQVAVFDVSDLVGSRDLQDLRAAVVRDDLPQVVRVAALDEYLELLEAGTVERATNSLIESINTFVEPRGNSSLRVTAADLGELAVAGTPAQHEWVRGFLASMRGFEGFIDIELKMYTIPEGHLGELVGGRTGVALDGEALAQLLRELDGLEGAEVVTAPRVMCNAGSPAEISMLDQTAYVSDYELTILPDVDQEIADPVIDVLQTGITFKVQAVPVGDDRLAAKVDFAYSTAQRPFPQKTLRIGARANEVTIQLPEVTTTKASARFELGPGAAVALSTVRPGVAEDGEDPRDVLVLMQARRVRPDPTPEELFAPGMPGGRRKGDR